MNQASNPLKKWLSALGGYVLFCGALAGSLKMLPRRGFETVRQMKKLGNDSFILVIVTAAFSGLVTAVQALYLTKGYIPTNMIGVMVGKSTMIELAPVLTALVLSGRAGASIAAEIGTMKVSEQLDALRMLAIDPVDFLYLPRVVAGVIAIPLLTVFSLGISLVSAFILSSWKYSVTAGTFFLTMRDFFEPSDLWGGLVKSVAFGFVITSLACHIGSQSGHGAEGVGRVTTLTVVFSSILILVMDFIIAALLFSSV